MNDDLAVVGSAALAMTSITVRPAVASERDALEALQWRASLNNPNDREALLQHPDAIELPEQQILDGTVWVAEEAGQITGFSAIVRRDDGDFELDGLFVEPTHWRRGIGRLLAERCAEAARAGGAGSLHLVGNPHAERFYRACGFQVVGTEATRFGVGLLMKRAILCPFVSRARLV